MTMLREEQVTLDDPRMTAAVDELEALIRQHYPTATFDVFERDDPDGVRLRAIVDVEDVNDVLDVVLERLYDLQVEQGLPIFVIPVQPATRVAEQLAACRARRPLINPRPLLQA